MYHTNEAYKATVATYPQKFDLSIEITFDESTGLDTVTVPPDDIFEAGFSEEIFLSTFYVGAAVEPRFWVRVHNQNGKYSENALATAEIRPRMTLYNEAGEALDAVPVGVFHVTKITAQNSDLRLECMDRMPYLNRLFEPQDVTSNLYAICRRIASTVGAEFKTTPFSLVTGETGNASTGQWITKKSILNAMVDDSIFKGYSYTQVLRFIAEVCGSFAIFDNEGNLELRWFKESDVTLTGDFARSALELNGNTFSMDGNVVQVTGVNVVSEDTELARVGTDKYLLTLNENPIATAMPQTAAEAVLFRMKNTKYIPCRYERIGGDPSVQLGDILTIIDNKERYDEAKADTYDRYSLFLTSRNWRYNGALSENYNASGNPDKDLNTDRGMTVSKRMAQLAKRVTEVEKNITDGMTDYEAALLMFNDKMFNANGLYKTVREKENGGVILYFHDETELENSKVIQMFSAAGFAWTTDGWNNGEPLWRYGFTDAGDAILNTINAYILSADIIKTGLLQSQNGASWINMDDGTFCFRSATPEGMDLDTGEAIYSYEKVLELANKQLNVYGTLRSLQYPSYSVSIGKSEKGNFGALTVTYNEPGYGDIFQVYPTYWYNVSDPNTVTDRGSTITAPFVGTGDGNRKGVQFNSNESILWNEKNLGSALLCGSDAFVSVFRDNINLSTNASHGHCWFNFYQPKHGYSPIAYDFGNGAGGHADVYCADCRSDRLFLKCDTIYGDSIINADGDATILGSMFVGGSGGNSNCKLNVNGAAGATSWVTFSDPSLKKNIIEQTEIGTLKKLLDMKFYSYDFKNGSSHVKYGTMANDAPTEIQTEDGKGIELYSYIGFTAKSVQELNEKCEKQASRITTLENRIEKLETLFANLAQQ